ncbi:MAG: tetratricopeptide repeat protein [Phycisphaeraceae bacterium]
MTLQLATDAARLLDRAAADLDAGLPAQALAQVQQALAIAPALAEARLVQARAHLTMDQAAQALTALDALLQYHPSRAQCPQVRAMRAQALLGGGHDELALVEAQKLIEQFPDDIRFHRLAGAAAQRLGQTARAVEAWQQVLRLAPNDQANRRRLAQTLAGGNTQAALEVLLQGATVYGYEASQVVLEAARLLRRAGRLREADDAFRMLLRRHDDDAGLWREAGELADELGDDAGATHRLTRAIALAPADRGVHQALAALAQVHMHAGRWAQACLCCWRAARRSPGAAGLTQQQGRQASAWAGLVVSALALRRSKLARLAHARLAAVTNRQQRRALLAPRWAHIAAGQQIAAIQTDERHLPTARATPLQAMLHRAVGVLTTHASRHARRADVQYHLAVCHTLLHEPAPADAAIQNALRINPRYAAAQRLSYRLTRTQRAAGATRKAA